MSFTPPLMASLVPVASRTFARELSTLVRPADHAGYSNGTIGSSPSRLECLNAVNIVERIFLDPAVFIRSWSLNAESRHIDAGGEPNYGTLPQSVPHGRLGISKKRPGPSSGHCA